MNEQLADGGPAMDADQALVLRLRELEASVDVPGGLPVVSARRGVPRGSRLALTGLAAVAVIAGGAAASGVLDGNVRARPGAFNAGQPLHCQGVATMTPREAARWLSAHGYDVTWQIEDTTPGVGKGQQRSEQTVRPPASGVISGAVTTSRTELIVVVETGPGAVQAEDCPR